MKYNFLKYLNLFTFACFVKLYIKGIIPFKCLK